MTLSRNATENLYKMITSNDIKNIKLAYNILKNNKFDEEFFRSKFVNNNSFNTITKLLDDILHESLYGIYNDF